MRIIVDTNVLARLININDPMQLTASNAIQNLILRGHDLHTLPQNHYELWVIATRPLANNGLGKSVDQARAELELADRNFPILPEPSTLYSEWKNLVQLHDCKGKIAHDARIVAAMIILGISDLLTFNCSDFARFPMLTVHDPKQLNATA